jgi:eukaryotic-like serine/threonine-protein kinase
MTSPPPTRLERPQPRGETTPEHDPFVGTLLAQRFWIEQRLASGGFGAIYRATHVATREQVAIKVLNPEWATNPDVQARFRREAQTLTMLRHPHTVTTYEVGEADGGALFIVMELLRGKSLFQHFYDHGPLPWQQVVTIARAVCSALGEAHSLGIVHRDLKPANIHLEPLHGITDFVKVLDFGIAKIMRGSNLDDGNELTNVGQMIGTFDYMSPEQILGGQCTTASDIYTLGVVMYEVIAGRRPFADAPGTALVAALLTQRPPPLSRWSHVPPDLDRIVMRCLEREPQDRHVDVGALAIELAQLADAAEVAARPTSVFATPMPVPICDEQVNTRLLARGSQPIIPPGGVWRTVPAQVAQSPRNSLRDLPRFDVSRTTTRDAWVGRIVWLLVIVIAILAVLAVRTT